jgi:hypothetical protein
MIYIEVDSLCCHVVTRTLAAPLCPAREIVVMMVRTDVNLLGRRIRLPLGTNQATWMVQPLGASDSAVPGPTDTELYAFLKLSPEGWSEVTAAGKLSATESVVLPDAVAAIVPSETLESAPRQQSGYRLEGEQYYADYFSLGPYRGLYALRVGDGLLVRLQSR